MEVNQQQGAVNYEQKTLASAAKSRTAWEAIRRHTDDEDFTSRGNIIWEAISDYYQRDENAQSADTEGLYEQVCLRVKRGKHRDIFADILSEINKSVVSPPNATAYFLGLKRENTAFALASALASGVQPEKVRPLLDKYESLLAEDSLDNEVEQEEVALGIAVADIFKSSYGGENLIQVYPDSLNERLGGGLLRGHHVVLFARPEVGKTLIAINMAYGFLQQGLRVLYVGNEDPIYDIVIRLLSRLTGMSRNEIGADPNRADALARSRGYENLIVHTLTPGTVREVEALVEKYEPDVLIVDQLRNLKSSAESRTTQLEAVCQGIRNLGKKHNILAVSVTQAGESAAGKSVLTQSDVDSSKTGIPGACDVMVGVGCTSDDELIGRRVISLPKNKPGGGNHSHFPVLVNTQTGEVRGT